MNLLQYKTISLDKTVYIVFSNEKLISCKLGQGDSLLEQ